MLVRRKSVMMVFRSSNVQLYLFPAQDAGLIAERNQSEYEKNKAKARKANIQFPTPFPTGLRFPKSSLTLGKAPTFFVGTALNFGFIG